MKRTLTNIIMMLTLVLAPAAIFTQPAYAECGNTPAEQQVFKGIDQGAPGSPCDSGGVTNAIAAAVRILSIIVGAVAVISIISSGFKYITSGGDSAKVGNAKNTLIYSLIGVAIAVLAQVLVHFVINAANNAASCPANQHLDASNKCVADAKKK